MENKNDIYEDRNIKKEKKINIYYNHKQKINEKNMLISGRN